MTKENGNVYSLNDTAEKVSGMYRDIDPNTGHGITYIEGNALSENGIASVGDVTSTGFNGNVYSLNTIGSNVSGIYRNIDPNTGAGVTAIEGNTFISENGIVTNSLTVGGIDIGEMAGTTSQIADKVQGIEPIQFRNNSLLDYSHIMEGGFLCLHTSYWTNPIQRLKSDFLQLKNWVVKYYVNRETDSHYEHLVVEHSSVDDSYFAIQYTQFEKEVEAGKCGYAYLAPTMDGSYNEKVVKNFIENKIKINAYGIQDIII